MDYVTRQFINLTKKFRKEFRKYQDALHNDLSRLTEGLKDLKDAVSTERQADDKRCDTPPVTISNLRTDVPIRVQTKTEQSIPERIWGYIKGTLETIGIVAVVIYTGVAFGPKVKIGDSLFVLGCILYRDEFGKTHTTKFCLSMEAVEISKEFAARRCSMYESAD
jgi:hypothetical protein